MRLTSRNGYLLPMVIMILLVSFIVGFATLNIGFFERSHATRRLNREAAFYLAEAGLQRACAHLKADVNWQPEVGAIPLGVGSFEVTRQDQGARIILVSVGRVRNQNERVELSLEPSGGLQAGGSFGQGLFGSDLIRIGNNALVDSYDSRLGAYSHLINHGSDGDLGSNDRIQVGNNAQVLGDAAVSGGGTISGETYISGQKDYDAELKTPNPVVIPPALLALPYPTGGDPRISGNFSLSAGALTVGNNKTATLAAGSYRFKRITVSNNATLLIQGDVTIYLEENLNISNNALLRLTQATYSMVFYLSPAGNLEFAQNAALNTPLTTPPGQARFYLAGTGTVNIENNVVFNGLIYAPERHANVENNAVFYGGLVVDELKIGNNASVHYDASLHEMTFPEDPGIGVPAELRAVNWTKPGWRERL